MGDAVAFGCNLRGRVAEGVASYRKVLHLRIQPLISATSGVGEEFSTWL